MSYCQTASLVVGYRQEVQDRVAVMESAERTVIVVADGAGGSGDGAAAADAVVREVQQNYLACNSAASWRELLQAIDFRIGSGESTAVVVDLQQGGIYGASVGDSRAWLIDPDAVTDLTQHQVRKPLLGSGNATPIAFEHTPLVGTLLVATDGLLNYIKRDAVTKLLTHAQFDELPRRLVELVRLPSGDLWDDIGIVVARRRLVRRTRKRYEID